MANSFSRFAPVFLSVVCCSTLLIADDTYRTTRYPSPEKSSAFKKRFPTTNNGNRGTSSKQVSHKAAHFDSTRAAGTLSDIQAVVSRMKKWHENIPRPDYSQNRVSTPPPTAAGATEPVPFNRARAAKSLAEITDVVKRMKADGAERGRIPGATSANIAAVQQFQRRSPVPTPDRVDPGTGATYRELAEHKLRAKGYVKTPAGWRASQQITATQQRPGGSGQVRKPTPLSDGELFR